VQDMSSTANDCARAFHIRVGGLDARLADVGARGAA
jgi:hypothetical protein